MKKAVLMMVAVLGLSGCLDVSEGERVGTITKFSHKGLACKTYEGELVMGGMRTVKSRNSHGDTVTSLGSNVFEFTVEDATLVDQIKAAMETGQAVRLEYKQEMFYNPCRSDTGYFITGVKPLQDTTGE